MGKEHSGVGFERPCVRAEAGAQFGLLGPKPREEILRNLKELRQLPQEVWKRVDRPVPGYNYRAEGAVVGLPFIALFDTGVSTNAIPEELVVDLINEARAQGFKWRTGEWPIDLET